VVFTALRLNHGTHYHALLRDPDPSLCDFSPMRCFADVSVFSR